MDHMVVLEAEIVHLQKQHDVLLQEMLDDEQRFCQKRRRQEKAFLDVQEALSRRYVAKMAITSPVQTAASAATAAFACGACVSTSGHTTTA